MNKDVHFSHSKKVSRFGLSLSRRASFPELCMQVFYKTLKRASDTVSILPGVLSVWGCSRHQHAYVTVRSREVLLEHPTTTGFQWGHLKNGP